MTMGDFIAWLASREVHESVRRRHRSEVEHYLRWCRTDNGHPLDRHDRYRRHVTRTRPQAEAAVCAALARYREHRQILELTSAVAGR